MFKRKWEKCNFNIKNVKINYFISIINKNYICFNVCSLKISKNEKNNIFQKTIFIYK